MNHSVGFSNTKLVQRVLARVIACGMLLGLSSCGIPPLRQGEPGPGLSPTFNGAASPDNSSQLSIDKFFNDPTLTSLIYQALAGNRELRILNEDVEIARNELLSRSGAYLPFVNFMAHTDVTRYSRFTLPGASLHDDPYLPGKFLPTSLPDYRVGLNFLWHLDIWRELRNARDAAVQRFLAAAERRNYFVTRLVAEIADNYYRLMALDQRLAILDLTIELQQKSLQAAARLKAAGRTTQLACPSFPGRGSQEPERKAGRQAADHRGREPYQLPRQPPAAACRTHVWGFLRSELSPLAVGVPAQLLQNRPDIRQAERELAAAGLDVKVARAHFFPKLDLSGRTSATRPSTPNTCSGLRPP